MNQLDLLTNRLRAIAAEETDIDSEISRLTEVKAALAVEREEVEAAAKVVARLSGQDYSVLVWDDGDETESAASAKPTDTPSIPEMISTVLGEAPPKGLEPKDIAGVIAKTWWPDVVVNSVASTCWRLWKQGRLVKDEGSSTYRLPQKDEAPDSNLPKEQSEASLFKPLAEGREAVPGGGT